MFVYLSPMLSVRFAVAFSLLMFMSIVTSASGRDAREQKRIDHLLQIVGGLGQARFIRNGTEYDAKAAESHLRQKLGYGGEKITTAEQFIDYCATRSSVSGESYKIRLADGTTVEAAPYLRGKLREFDQVKE